MADGDIKTIIEIQRLLDDCPFGFHGGHIATHRATTEADMIAWLQRLEALRLRLNDFVSRQLQPPKDNTP